MRKRVYVYVGLGLLYLATATLFFLQISAARQTTKHLIQEIRNNSETIDYVNQNINLMAQDTNGIRKALNLPKATYLFKSEDSGEADQEDGPAAFIQALDYIVQNNNAQHSLRQFTDFKQQKPFREFLVARGLSLVNKDELNFSLLKNGDLYFSVSQGSDGRISFRLFSGEEIFIKSWDRGSGKLLEKKITQLDSYYRKLSAQKKQFRTIAINSELAALLKQKELYLQAYKEDLLQCRFDIELKQHIPLYSLILDKQQGSFRFKDKSFKEFNPFLTALFADLRSVDSRTPEEKRVASLVQEIQGFLEDQGFQAILESKGLILGSLPREDNDYFYFDLYDQKKNHLGGFAVLKRKGEIYLMDPHDIPLCALSSLNDLNQVESKKKIVIPENLPIIDQLSDKEGFTFLVCGTHENNTDAIILVHTDAATQKIHLISIPRDLYYKGRKINDIYRSFGPGQLVEELSAITALNIKKYICIDMYAFIDAVNIIGGIDVTLDEDLIDPSYKTFDNGQWGTLFLKKGIHHVNGRQALRIARSRHYSVTFSRAKRQQKVIEAIKNRFSQLDFTDIDKLYQLTMTLFRYLDTNFTPVEIINSYLTYKNYAIAGQNVVDTTNILEQTYANIYKLKGKNIPIDENFYKGAWIVVPQNDDWNSIRWYIRQLIQG